MEEIVSIQEQRRNAMIHRADKLLSWLVRDTYAIYTGEQSITQLIKLIDLIEWALENSMPVDEWRTFRNKLYDARNVMIDISKDAVEQTNYNRSLQMLADTLTEYKEYIRLKI